jgi:hypothetical protein
MPTQGAGAQPTEAGPRKKPPEPEHRGKLLSDSGEPDVQVVFAPARIE